MTAISAILSVSSVVSTRSVLAGLFRLQIAVLMHARKVQAGRRKFRDLRPSPSGNLHLKDARANQLTRGAFVHGEETAANPVPSVIVVRVVHADHHFNLRLPPEARTVGRSQRDAG